jgi:transposase-like protein
MQTQNIELIQQTLHMLYADEMIDLKKDFDHIFHQKTESKDALHQVIRKERKRPEYCEVCGSLHIVKNGKTPAKRQKYRCADCGKSYSDTRDSITASSKKPYYVWEEFILCMMNGYSLRKTSALIDVSTTTAFHWRHKVMEAMKKYAVQKPLKEDIQIDETYILLNMKGMKSLPRKAKKRQVSSEKRGVNNEHVCVLTAIDSNDQLLLEVIDQGNPNIENIINALDGRIQEKQTIITDSKSAYIEVAKKYKATLHQIPSGFYSNGQYHLGDINEVHSRLKLWLSQFKGVSTKHLSRYLAWFRFKRLLDYQYKINYHNRITMNHSIREIISFLIKEIHCTPFPIDIYKPYS